MPANENGPVFFVSYARRDFDDPGMAARMREFVSDVETLVAVDLGLDKAGVAFLEVNDVHAGQFWTSDLADAIRTCKVGVPLFSPSYFARPWCGKEFQVFIARSGIGQDAGGIVPVRWARRLPSLLPGCAAKIQYTDSLFPSEYVGLGLQQLQLLKAAMPDKYQLAVLALSQRIVEAATTTPLREIDNLDLDNIGSAWDAEVTADPRSHTKGSISKTCFVYVARDGWGWKPYGEGSSSIGAMAQQVSGELGLRYEEIACDASLESKLIDTHSNSVPTIVFGDPSSFSVVPFVDPMRKYDRQYLLNCATLMAWDDAMKATLDNHPHWIDLNKTCPQKVSLPPPNDEWRSIFSSADLETKTRLAIEGIRSRLMKQLMAEPSAAGASPVRKAEDSAVAATAASQGISTSTLAQLSSSPE